jgi:hypothetical protein
VKKKEWLKTEIDELIDLYHNKPVLWNVKDKAYRDRITKRDALVEMAEIFATSAEEYHNIFIVYINVNTIKMFYDKVGLPVHTLLQIYKLQKLYTGCPKIHGTTQ